MERVARIISLTLLALSLAYAISTTLSIVNLETQWKRCRAVMTSVGDTCSIEYHKYGQEVIYKKGE